MRKLIFLAVLLAAALCASFALAETTTVMVYMCGSDLSGAGFIDITEMLNSGLDAEQVRVMLLTGGAAKSDNVYFQPGQVKLSVLQKKSKSPTLKVETLEIRENMNMGDPATLIWFLSACAEYSATDRYALILWDHGGGPMEGVCYDEAHSKDRLSLSELSFALGNSPFKDNRLSWIGFDACLMASLETGQICAPFTRYMIASQETEPATGWNYGFLKGIEQDASGLETGARIKQMYLEPKDGKKLTTLSCTDLDAIDSVTDAVNAFFAALDACLNADTYSSFSNLRQSAKSFGRATTNSDYDLVDLYHMASQYAKYVPEESSALQAALKQAVADHGGNVPNAFGLSIYSPYRNKNMFSSSWQTAYKAMDFLSAYSDYLDSYADYWFGKQMADWSRLQYRALPLGEDLVQTVELQLTDGQLAHYASAQMIVLRETGGSNTYNKIFEVDGVSLDHGVLRADYDYSALYVLNEYGRPVTDSYPFFRIDEYYYVEATLESASFYETITYYGLNIPSGARESENVLLRCRLHEETGELEVLGLIPFPDDPDELITGRQTLELEDDAWPYLYFANDTALTFLRDREGQPLPVSKWPEVDAINYRRLDRVDRYGNVEALADWSETYTAEETAEKQYLLWGEVDNRTSWRLQFLPRQLSGMDLYAQYILTDTQGYQISTELIPLNNPALVSRKTVDIEIFNQNSITVSLVGIDVVDSDISRGLGLRFEARNDTKFDYSFDLLEPFVNLSGLKTQLHTSQTIASRDVSRLYVRLDAGLLPPLPDGFIHTIGFTPSVQRMDLTRSLEDYLNIPEIHGELVTLNEEIDFRSVAHLTAWPYAEMLGETELEGIRFAVAELYEKEDGSLDGVLYIANHSGGDKVLRTRREGVDSILPAVVNGNYCANCLNLFYGLALPDGGEACIPFTIHRESSSYRFSWNTENAYGKTDIFDYWGISSVEQLGMVFHIQEGLGDEGSAMVHTVLIPLSRPLSLSKEPKNTPVRTRLADSDGITLDLCRIAWQDGKLLVEGDYTCSYDTNEVFALYLFDCQVDGAPVNARIFPETAGEYQEFPIISYKAVKERFILELSGADSELSPDFGLLSMQFAFNSSKRDLQYLTPAQLRPPENTPLSGSPLGAEAFSVTPAHMIDTFSPALILPQEPSRYAVTLRAPFSREQYTNMIDAWVMLVFPREDGSGLYELCALLNYQPKWNGQELRVDYCGLVLSIQGGQYPLACYINNTQNGYLYQTTGQIAVNGLKLSGNLRLFHFDAMSVLYRQEDGTAAFSDFSGNAIVREEDADPVVYSYCPSVRIPRRADGTFGLMELVAPEEDVFLRQDTFTGIQPAIALRPAEEFPLLAVFFVRETRGPGYSLVIPYEQAVRGEP